MITLIVCLLAGMVLGQRFKVLILVPAAAAVIVLAIIAGLAYREASWPIALMAMASAASLQLGYLSGLAIRQVLLGGRVKPMAAPARRPASLNPLV